MIASGIRFDDVLYTFVAHTEAKAIIEDLVSSAVYVVGAPGLDNIKNSPLSRKKTC